MGGGSVHTRGFICPEFNPVAQSGGDKRDVHRCKVDTR